MDSNHRTPDLQSGALTSWLPLHDGRGHWIRTNDTGVKVLCLNHLGESPEKPPCDGLHRERRALWQYPL